MTRTTIDFGIHLGTANSAIAVSCGTSTEVIRNSENQERTPSVVWIDKSGNLNVGTAARNYLGIDPENACAEFILQMGREKEFVFARSGRRMRPEELSAEVLKSLISDVYQRTEEEVSAAVITVPVASEMSSIEATLRAAQMAGITQSPLLQEPVAAAFAYGFQREADKSYCLVFDLGDGTFDATVIQLRNGRIQVVNHGGDNNLGSEHIDWAIVDQLLIPAVDREFSLENFRRGNVAWGRAISVLKYKAGEVKTQLSLSPTHVVYIEDLCKDRNGKDVSLKLKIKREEVERLAEPIVSRAIDVCKRTLREKRLATSDISKLLLVGGSTLPPYLRERLSDPKFGLGIPLEFSIDPLTVIAQGAAMFAGTQRVDTKSRPSAVNGEFRVQLKYSPVGPETEPLVGGQVVGATPTDLSGYTIEFINNDIRPEWRSGRIGLSSEGRFMTNLGAEKGKLNMFKIALRDSKGKARKTSPDTLQYTVGKGVMECLERAAKNPTHGGYELPGVPSGFCEAKFGVEPSNPLSGPGTTDQKAAVEAKKRGDVRRYVELYLKALDLGIDEEYDVSTLRMGLGQAYVQLKSPKEAIQQFCTVLALRNRAPVAVWQAAMYMYYIYDELGRSAEARKLRQLADHANKIVQLRHDSTLESEVRQLARERLGKLGSD